MVDSATLGDACLSRVRGSIIVRLFEFERDTKDTIVWTSKLSMMENDPPRPVGTRPASRTSLMHPLPHSKSSPAKRDLARILTPQYNHSTSPSGDVFNTGLLTPQASQNTVELDAAKSLISPPPEDTTRAGTSRPSVRFIQFISLSILT